MKSNGTCYKKNLLYLFDCLFIPANLELFFCGHEENRQITPSAQGGAEGSDRLLLTENPARSFICPSCWVRDISFEKFLQPCQLPEARVEHNAPSTRA